MMVLLVSRETIVVPRPQVVWSGPEVLSGHFVHPESPVRHFGSWAAFRAWELFPGGSFHIFFLKAE